MRLCTPKAILSGAAGVCFFAGSAFAQVTLTIPAESLKKALDEYIGLSGVQLIYSVADVSDRRSHAVRAMSPDEALPVLLQGTGLVVAHDDAGAIVVSLPVRLTDSGEFFPTESVVVTGSRIPGNDYFSPPVTFLSIDDLAQTTPSNVPDGLNKLPMFAPAQTSNSTTSGANGRGFRPNGNFLDLRGLGPNRTLVLEDGRRVPATFYDGTIDANTLPQLLIKRVEIVTGGASAVYGSDAVTGVVNFILDKSFEGIKGVAQAGVSNYGDAKSFRLGVAGGHDLSERSHLIWSVEYYDRAAITDQAARPYGNLATSIVGNGTVATPYTLVSNVRRSDGSYGGLVTSGPFSGLQFADNGSLVPFNPGTPTTTAGISIGGDGGLQHNEYLLPVLNTFQAFGRFDYMPGADLNIFLQAGYSQTRSYEANQVVTNSASGYPLTIYSGNAFLKPDQQAVLDSTHTGSFTLSRVDDELSRRLALRYHTGAMSLTAGADGTAFRSFKWDAFYTHGESRTTQAALGNVNAERLYAAIDAVRDPATGSIVCRAALIAPAAYQGCVPFNPFGVHSPSEGAIGYVEGTTSWTARNTLDDFGANLAGTLVEGLAGPIKMALGVEYRMQGLDLGTTVPDLNFNSQYLRVGGPTGTTVPAGNLKWQKETQSTTNGSNSVYEGDLELTIPIARNLPLMQQVSVDGAYRYTNYSTSGAASTWKLGLEWQVIDELDLRASRSRDIRAPTLYDLFQRPLTTNSGLNDTLTSSSGTVNTVQVGNTALKPEVANNTSAGFVYTPSWLAGFRLSADYFHVGLDNAIAVIQGSTPTVQNACLASGGTSPLCALTVRPFPLSNTTPANFPTLVYAVKLNIARTYSEGVDLEADYHDDLASSFGWVGTLDFRLLWTHQPVFKTQSLPGVLVTDAAGTAQTPTDRIALTAGYAWDGFSLNILERFQSSFRQSSSATLVYNIPNVRPYYQTDLDVAYDFQADNYPLTGFLAISNLFNTQGGLYQVPAYTGSPGMNYPIGPGADLIGRYFTIGLRLRAS
jgi:iron complex outermembrane receptor protein